MSIIQLCKASLVGGVALFFTFVAFGNITDYDSNWQFVRHVLSMDTTFPDSSLHWRAITNPTVQAVGYRLIIAAETFIAILLWIGGALLLSIEDRLFFLGKLIATVGLTLGFLLYAVGFVAIGGEWFAMWQSTTWNGEQKAFEFIGMIGAVLIILLLSEQNGRPGRNVSA